MVITLRILFSYDESLTIFYKINKFRVYYTTTKLFQDFVRREFFYHIWQVFLLEWLSNAIEVNL